MIALQQVQLPEGEVKDAGEVSHGDAHCPLMHHPLHCYAFPDTCYTFHLCPSWGPVYPWQWRQKVSGFDPLIFVVIVDPHMPVCQREVLVLAGIQAGVIICHKEICVADLYVGSRYGVPNIVNDVLSPSDDTSLVYFQFNC